MSSMKNLKVKKLFVNTGLNTKYLREFRNDAKKHYQVWRLDNGFHLAIEVYPYGDEKYAKETRNYGEDHTGAKAECDRLRREYIIKRAKQMKNVRKVY